jgi:glycosyltransferase involved in cell wall biosynthesis
MAYRNYQLKDALNQAGQLIAPTQFVRDTYHQLGLNPEIITVIPHGIQIPQELPTPIKEETSLLRAVYIGGLAPQKGIHVLIEAMNRLKENKIQLDIYGDMTAFPDYVARLQSQARQSNIRFNGRLPHESLWQVLAKSDVVIVPSLWYETASLITQEAFAAGVPVIASDIGALRERVRDELDGLLFPPGDVAALSAILEDLYHHPVKLIQLASSIQPVFTIDQHYQAVQKTYQLVLAQPSLV